MILLGERALHSSPPAQNTLVKHASEILALLEAVMLHAQITIIHFKAHIKYNDLVSVGNNRADRYAKAASRLLLQASLVPNVSPFSPQYIQEETQRALNRLFLHFRVLTARPQLQTGTARNVTKEIS